MTTIEVALAALAAGETVSARATRDVIVASGVDAAEYLQGQVSQDVVGLDVGATAWSFVLQPQGKVDGWFRVTRLATDRFVFDLESGFGSPVVDRLNRFKLRMDVDIAIDEAQMVAVRGPGAVGQASGIAEEVGAVVVPASWNNRDQRDVLFIDNIGQPLSSGPEQVELASLTWVDPAFVEWDRIERGVPAMGSELDESTIPAAAAVVDVSTDFTKGCYVGQELVARVDSRGSNTPTKLVRLSADSSAQVMVGAALLADEVEVGRVTSAASSGTRLAALAYLRRSVVDNATDWPISVSVTADNGDQITASAELVRHPIED